VRAPEMARARGGVAGKHVVVGASTVESAIGSGGRFRRAEPTEQRGQASERAAELTSGAHRTERRLACAEKAGADKSSPPGSERERERARGGQR
jgi:hypothetical protein